ncbi:MAG TPA: carboxymuconolactone decarboxylase family protein [Candidatus Hydrogenedentes bacterium]|nr:carboxymuconolactone decarboxylase family protein [Candidatus Hydrogenedentota bacterium]HPG66409.1 carboxymuconolactone decarboxylase family protein [Candidatus Hydrogenedentota bacterium]
MSTAKGFRKRHYRSFGQFWADVRFSVGQRRAIRGVMDGPLIDGRFRERLMLAVTEVNGCRFCSFAHTRAALSEGLSEGEVRALLRGLLEDVPEDQRTAVLYAQHWAETEGHPDPEALDRIEATYGKEMADAIHLVLRVIRMGNYTGNTVDYLLFRLSFGRWCGQSA